MNQNSIYEEIKSRLKSGNALLSSVAEVFAFDFALKKYKDMQNYNFAICFVRV